MRILSSTMLLWADFFVLQIGLEMVVNPKASSLPLAFRRARAEDARHIAYFFSESTSGLCDAVLGPQSVECWLLDTGNAHGVRACTVALIDDNIAGHVISYAEAGSVEDSGNAAQNQLLIPFRQLRRQDSWYISSLYVQPQFRSLGIGTQLLSCAMAEASKQGSAQMSLHVFAERSAAVRLYQYVGFEIADRRPPPKHPHLYATSEILLMVAPIDRICERIMGILEYPPAGPLAAASI